VRAIRKDGTSLPVSLSIGQAQYRGRATFVAIIQDLSNVARQYFVSAADRALLAMVAASSNDGIVAVTLDGTIRTWNHAAEIIYGYPARKMIGRPVTEVLALLSGSDRIAGKLDFFARAFSGETMPPYDSECVHANGYTVHVRVLLSPIRNAQGVMVGLSITLRDVTEQKTFGTQRALFSAIIESSNDAIVACGTDGTVTIWNPAAARMMGYTANEIISRPIAVVIPQSKHSELKELLSRLSAGEAFSRHEMTMLRRNGSLLEVFGTLSPIQDESGAICGASMTFHDITVHKTLEKRLQLLREALRQLGRLNEMNQMSAGMAHELNQPLAAIANYASVAKRRMATHKRPNIEELRKIVLKLAEQAMRAGEVIQRTRERVEKRRVATTLEDANDVVAEAVSIGPLNAALPDVTVSLSLAPALLPVRVDRLQIQQVVLNLMSNAIDAVAHCPRREVTISTAQLPNAVEIAVSDTGSGIPDDIVEQLFLPFVTTKPEGLGLGLAMARSIVESHRGQIRAEPNAGGGTVFRFTIPVAPQLKE
jgi:two-component system sensor kinase FixL